MIANFPISILSHVLLSHLLLPFIDWYETPMLFIFVLLFHDFSSIFLFISFYFLVLTFLFIFIFPTFAWRVSTSLQYHGFAGILLVTSNVRFRFQRGFSKKEVRLKGCLRVFQTLTGKTQKRYMSNFVTL